MTTAPGQIKPESMDHLLELLWDDGVSTDGWGRNGIHTLKKLLKTLQENHVYFIRHHERGEHGSLMLHVHSAVMLMTYMSDPTQKLYEAYQIMPDRVTRKERHQVFDGLGETLNHKNGSLEPEDPLAGAYRLIEEELGQSQPLFYNRSLYTVYHHETIIMGPMPHDKWPIPAVFVRSKHKCDLPEGSPLYLPQGYKEEEEDGRTIYFAWRK